jgi:phenylacetate-CoA ligase
VAAGQAADSATVAQAVKALQHDIKTFVGSSAQIEPQAEGSMERSMGKAKRVLDLRG